MYIDDDEFYVNPVFESVGLPSNSMPTQKRQDVCTLPVLRLFLTLRDIYQPLKPYMCKINEDGMCLFILEVDQHDISWTEILKNNIPGVER